MKTVILLTHSNRCMGTLIYRSTPFCSDTKTITTETN